MKHYQRIALLSLGSVVAILLVVGHVFARTAEDTVSYIHAVYPADVADDRILMGAAHNVFIGKVGEQVGTKSRTSVPESQYRVEVLDNVKGTLTGDVVVNQEGGYKDGVFYMMDDSFGNTPEDPYLLKPGSTYLFATRYSPEEDWYTLISFHTGRTLISSDGAKTDGELVALANENTRVTTLKDTYEDEILLYADVAVGNARNSYQSTHPEAPASLTTRDVEQR